MHWKPKGWTLIGMLLLAVPGAMTVMKVAEAAQATGQSTIDTTQVQIRFIVRMGRWLTAV